MVQPVRVRSQKVDGAEIAWFAPICNGDFLFLGEMDPAYRSNFANNRDVVLAADSLGYKNVLCPSSYQVGQDTLLFAAAMAPMLKQTSLLVAIRCGEFHPPMLARALTTLDHMLEGRLTVNIISSDLPGEVIPSSKRYARSREVVQILRQAWTGQSIDFAGEFYKFQLPIDPVVPYQTGGPLLYFGGYSPDALDLCAEFCDVYLMWPETQERLLGMMKEVEQRASKFDRVLDFGLRIHVIVGETEKAARREAERLVSRLDADVGVDLRNRSQDAQSLGVARQSEMRSMADKDGYVEPQLWTGIGRARSGCGGALVGDPDQIVAKLQQYQDMGIRAFILSGYPHKASCELFARDVLPRLKNISLPMVQGRIPSNTPATPLGNGERR